VNIHDVAEVVNDGRPIVEQIFEAQRKLMDKYHEIEIANGLRLDVGIPVDINSHKGQYVLKDFCWRVTEELMESEEAHADGDHVHAREEAADALHFLTELCILSGMGCSDVAIVGHRGDYFSDESMDVVYHLGMAANCLKNKPWKQTQMLTDIVRYRDNIIIAYQSMGRVFSSLKVDESGIFDFYFKKNKVNQFRQRSNY
jgi:hypothetical protein